MKYEKLPLYAELKNQVYQFRIELLGMGRMGMGRLGIWRFGDLGMGRMGIWGFGDLGINL
jgi:hypothetical protein